MMDKAKKREFNREDSMLGGIFLIGLGVLFFTGYIWPGILILLGLIAIAKGTLMKKTKKKS